MNTVGKAGGFIIKYQVQIELILVLILAAAAVFFLVRAVINAGKKRQLLSQINDTVTEINTAVTSLSEKKSDVIYIDNRTSGAEEGQGCTAESRVSSALENADSADSTMRNASQASAELSESEGSDAGACRQTPLPECLRKQAELLEDRQEGRAEAAETEPESVRMSGDFTQTAEAAAETSSETGFAAEEPEEAPKKYFSRDCNISKSGKTYTVEELEKQIKE